MLSEKSIKLLKRLLLKRKFNIDFVKKDSRLKRKVYWPREKPWVSSATFRSREGVSSEIVANLLNSRGISRSLRDLVEYWEILMTELKRNSWKLVRLNKILVNELRLVEKSFISLFIILPNSKIQQLVFCWSNSWRIAQNFKLFLLIY